MWLHFYDIDYNNIEAGDILRETEQLFSDGYFSQDIVVYAINEYYITLINPENDQHHCIQKDIFLNYVKQNDTDMVHIKQSKAFQNILPDDLFEVT